MTNEEAVKGVMKIWTAYTTAYAEVSHEDVEACSMAIEALEKQIPEPMMEELDISGRPIRVCGNCGDAPGNGEFCHWCGQRIERRCG